MSPATKQINRERKANIKRLHNYNKCLKFIIYFQHFERVAHALLCCGGATIISRCQTSVRAQTHTHMKTFSSTSCRAATPQLRAVATSGRRSGAYSGCQKLLCYSWFALRTRAHFAELCLPRLCQAVSDSSKRWRSA